MEIEKNYFDKSFKPKNIAELIQDFDDFDYRIHLWENKGIWKIDEDDCNTTILKQFILELKPQIIEFVREGFSRKTSEKFNRDFNFMRKLAFGIAKFEDIQKALFYANNWRGLIGLELAKIKIILFQKNHKRLPLTTDEEISGVVGGIWRGTWKKFGINLWNDILIYTFGEEKLKEWEELKRKQKFDQTVVKMQKFIQKHQRLPKSKDEAFIKIHRRISSGFWSKYGINKWNDMLLNVFGEVNFDFGKHHRPNAFNSAIGELQEYYKKERKLPIQEDFYGILGVIRSGHWREKRIHTWNDLLLQVFGEVHKNEWDYSDKDIFKKVQKKLIEFKEKHGRMPKIKNKGMFKINHIIKKGLLKGKEINTWSELLIATFNKANRERYKYIGYKGLQKAIEELRDFYERRGKVATTLDKGGIYGALRRGEWIDYQIEKWEDLINLAYKGIDLHPFKYSGDKGWERAIRELKDFKQKNKKLPRIIDLKQIWYIIKSGEWKKHGIKTWTDLLLHVFGKVNASPNKYKGKDSFEIVKKDLKEFKQKNGRLPRHYEMRAVRYAIRRGEWSYLGIKKWNDLIMYVFGEVNVIRNKYIGEKGLEIAIHELKEFKKIQNRIPKSDDNGIGGIISAIYRGRWLSYDIRNWNDILYRVFGEINNAKFIYKGEDGLELVVNRLKTFEKENKSIPHYKDKGMSGIYKAVMRGEWSDLGIKKWIDLINFTFNEEY